MGYALKSIVLPPLLLFASMGCVRADEPVLSDRAYGALRFGSTLSQAERVVGTPATALSPHADPACRYVRFAAYPNIRFMVENDRITRGEAGAGVPNVLGISIGAGVDDLRARFPGMVMQPHKYDPNGSTLLFRNANGKTALVIEASNGRVTHIRAGVQPAVEYVEGCG